MFENDSIEPAISCRLLSGQQRSVALAQRDHMPRVIQKVDQLAIPPDTALLERRVVASSLPPHAFQLLRIELACVVSNFE